MSLSGCTGPGAAAGSLTGTPGSAADSASGVSFEAWLADFKAYAREQGIAPTVIERAFRDVRPLPRVVEANENQPEFQRPIWAYLESAVSPSRVSRGRQHLAENAQLLAAIEQRYGVPSEILVAIWGLESDYGNNYGDLPVISALATLGWHGSRADFAREQLLAVLRILERGDLAPELMIGSWAGAMGQTQFIPTTFVAYAVDGDGDGVRDLWGSKADVFSSTANVLASAGWQPAREVAKLKANTTADHLTISASFAVWRPGRSPMGDPKTSGRFRDPPDGACPILEGQDKPGLG